MGQGGGACRGSPMRLASFGLFNLGPKTIEQWRRYGPEPSRQLGKQYQMSQVPLPSRIGPERGGNGGLFQSPLGPQRENDNPSQPLSRSQGGNGDPFRRPLGPQGGNGNSFGPPFGTQGRNGSFPPPLFGQGGNGRFFPPSYIPRGENSSLFPPPFGQGGNDRPFSPPFGSRGRNNSFFPPPFGQERNGSHFPPSFERAGNGSPFSPPFGQGGNATLFPPPFGQGENSSLLLPPFGQRGNGSSFSPLFGRENGSLFPTWFGQGENSSPFLPPFGRGNGSLFPPSFGQGENSSIFPPLFGQRGNSSFFSPPFGRGNGSFFPPSFGQGENSSLFLPPLGQGNGSPFQPPLGPQGRNRRPSLPPFVPLRGNGSSFPPPSRPQGGPMTVGQRRGYSPEPPLRPGQLERRYQMSHLPLPAIPSRIVTGQGENESLLQPPFGPPAQSPQASPRCPSEDASRMGTWSEQGSGTLSQATGIKHGSQAGFYPPYSSFGSGQSGSQQGVPPGGHPGQGSGVILGSSSYGVRDPWVSPSGQRPSGAEGMFGPRPGAGGHEEWSPSSSDVSGTRPYRPPSRGEQHSEYGPGTLTGYDQRPEGGRPPYELLGTGASGQVTGDLGYPSPGSGIYGFGLNGGRPPFYTPRTLTEGRVPEDTASEDGAPDVKVS